jgi:glycosyltransferase involved in cell wall biosynthesis
VIVVPSDGLARELMRLYPGVGEKVVVIRNTVDLVGLERPDGFDRDRTRAELGATEQHTVFVFVALGHFERKGLPLLLEALRTHADVLQDARLWVVGGERGLVASYTADAERLGVAEKVVFVGKTDDVRPFLWSADAFVAPSHYEAFSLGLLEAAAARLPLIVTRISGSEELVSDGLNGFEVERSCEGIAGGLRRLIELDAASRESMARAARESVEPLGPERFEAAWRALYAQLEA